MRRNVIAIVLSMQILPLSFARADDCPALLAIVEAAESGFSRLLAKSLPDDRWRSRENLASYQSCWIARSNGMKFECESAPLGDVASAKEFIAEQGLAFSKCLGSSWHEGPILVAGSFGLMNSERLIAINLMPSQRIEISGSAGARDVHDARLWIAPMSRPAAATPTAQTKPQRNLTAAELGDVCSSLVKILKSADGKFTDLKRRQSMAGSWRSKISIESVDDCAINELSDTVYHTCRWQMFADRDDATAGSVALAQVVRACLGDGWSEKRRISRRNNTTIYDFERGDDDPEVQIRAIDYRDGKWGLLLDVDVKQP